MGNNIKKNILFVLPYLPYKGVPHAGGRFTYHWLEHLSKNNNLFGAVFLNSNEEKHKTGNIKGMFSEFVFVPLSQTNKYLHALLYFFLPFRIAFRCSVAFLLKLLSFKRHNIDMVVVDHSIMGAYIPFLRFIFPSSTIIWNIHELYSLASSREALHSSGFKKMIFLLEIWKSKYWERVFCNKCDVVFTFSSKEKECMGRLRIFPDKINVIGPHVLRTDEAMDRSPDEEGVFFFGKMNREENVKAAIYFIDKIFPLIKVEYPEVRFYVIGADPNSRLQELSRDRKDVVVTGYVRNIKDYLSKTKVAIFPLFLGAGVRFKVLDSLMWGKPVVTSSVGAEGLIHQPEIVKIADDPQVMAQHVLYYLNTNESVYKDLSRQARQFVENNYNWQENCARIDGIMDEYLRVKGN